MCIRDRYNAFFSCVLLYNFFFCNSNFFRYFIDGWFFSIFSGVCFSCIQHLIGCIPKRTANPDDIVVSELPSDFPYNHGYRISGKFDFHIDVEVIYGLHQPDTADLKKVIQIFSTHGDCRLYTSRCV